MRTGVFAAGLASGLAIGAASSDHTPPPAQHVRSVETTEATRAAGLSAVAQEVASQDAEEAGDAFDGLLAEWFEGIEADRLASMASKVTGAGLDLVAEGVIGRLEEDSLRALIASTTDYSSDDLEDVEDISQFAKDLARIAMDGTVREAAEPDDAVRPIDFSEEITWEHRAAFAQSQFSTDTPRIYAVFESEGLGVSETLAKWTRVSDGEIVLFKRHRIRSAADSSFVYLDAPDAGWRPGEYRVDFYSADPELRWLASGEHRVSS